MKLNILENDEVSAKAIDLITLQAWQLAERILYPSRSGSFNGGREKAKLTLELYFALGMEKLEKGDSHLLLRHYHQYTLRLLIAKNFVLKKQGRYIAEPHLYFDPNFTGGFCSTKSWLANWELNQQNKPNINPYEHLIALVNCLLREETTPVNLIDRNGELKRYGEFYAFTYLAIMHNYQNLLQIVEKHLQ